MFATGLAIALGVLTFGSRILVRQREHEFTLGQNIAALAKQLAAQRRETAATQRELDLAAHQLAELPAPARPDESASGRARSTATAAWLDRFHQLQQRFEQEPGQRIPEMRLLGDEDWLLAVKTNSLTNEEDVRKARAALREAAKRRFGDLLKQALINYRKLGGDAPPREISVLFGFLDPPVAPDIVQRYKIWNPPTYESPSPTRRAPASIRAWEIREREPIDADYDTCLTATAAGEILNQSWSNPGLHPGN